MGTKEIIIEKHFSEVWITVADYNEPTLFGIAAKLCLLLQLPTSSLYHIKGDEVISLIVPKVNKDKVIEIVKRYYPNWDILEG